MSLYDIIPEGLFSVLASKNKGLYCSALFVVLDAFKTHLKISKEILAQMIQTQLEYEIDITDFSEEDIYENENGLSGKAHFLIRKFKETGWIIVEYEDDFVEYVTVPNFSYKIIQTLFDIANTSKNDNAAYVYSTYSALKTADEKQDPFEMVTALNDAEKRTRQLVENLTSVYHDIKYYNQLLVEQASVNSVLRDHFGTYQQKVVEPILFPLKVKDSVPRYKIPIRSVLQKWLVYDDIINSMTNHLKLNSESDTSEIDSEVRRKIHYILSVYDTLEEDYITPIDERNRKYTRSTTQKIDYLINADNTIKGTLVKLLHSLSDNVITENILDEAQKLFEIYEQEYVSDESLYQRKKGIHRERRSELIMLDDRDLFEEKAKAAAGKLMGKKFSRERVNLFVADILGDNDSAELDANMICDDESYVFTLLSAVYSKRKDSFYNAEISSENINTGKYTFPKIKYIRRKLK